MAINDDLAYEENERGELMIVKSVESIHSAYLRFTNRTSHPVEVWWRDFSGIKRHYIHLEPGEHYDVNSFLTHPWQFTDTLTNEQYAINNKVIFRAPNHIGGMMYRTNWNISVRVRPLRRLSLLLLATLLPNADAASMLGLPAVLREDLAELTRGLNRTPPEPLNADQ